MAQPVEGGRGEQPVGRERLVPFGEVEVTGHDRGTLLVTFGDEVVQVLVGGWSQGLQAEVVDDEQCDACEGGELAVVAAGGAGSVEAGGELGAGGEQDVGALADGAVAERLGEMALAGAAGSDDQDRGAFATRLMAQPRIWLVGSEDVLCA